MGPINCIFLTCKTGKFKSLSPQASFKHNFNYVLNSKEVSDKKGIGIDYQEKSILHHKGSVDHLAIYAPF